MESHAVNEQTWNKFLDKNHNANKGQNAVSLHSVRSKCRLHVQSTPCILEYSVVDVALFALFNSGM